MRDPSEKVVVGYLYPGLVQGEFMESMIHLLMFDTATHQRIVDGGGFMAAKAGTNLAGPRNGLVERFLEYGAADWLWMVDADMTFRADIVEKLLEYADPDKAPIVGGLCFGFDADGDVQPTLYGVDDVDGKTQVVRFHTWEPDAMFQVAATGAACLLVHRSAFERIRDYQSPKTPDRTGFNQAYPWFQETETDGRPVSEDITFCWRAGMCEIPVYVNTSINLGHVKQRTLTLESYFVANGLLSPTHVGAQI